MKKILLIVSIISLSLICFGCANEERNMVINQDDINQTYTLEEEASYPMDENGSVEVYYAQQLLNKKIKGEEIHETDDELINHCFVNENIGIALVDARTIGMQKVVSQIYRTLDGGETWDLLDDQLFFNSGAFNCVDIDDKLIISNFASVTQSNIFIVVDVEGNLDTISSEEVASEVDLSGLYAEMRMGDDGSKIICNWVKDYNSEKIVYVSQHDKEFATISLEEYGRGKNNGSKQ